MADLEMSWAGDLTVSSTGDLATIADPSLGTERVLRRLMTNPGDYLWNPGFGAGLSRYVGQPVNLAELQALIRTQMQLEAAVSATPEPVISISSENTGLFIQIRYEDSAAAVPASISAILPG